MFKRFSAWLMTLLGRTHLYKRLERIEDEQEMQRELLQELWRKVYEMERK